jgi:hypothetical protein
MEIRIFRGQLFLNALKYAPGGSVFWGFLFVSGIVNNKTMKKSLRTYLIMLLVIFLVENYLQAQEYLGFRVGVHASTWGGQIPEAFWSADREAIHFGGQYGIAYQLKTAELFSFQLEMRVTKKAFYVDSGPLSDYFTLYTLGPGLLVQLNYPITERINWFVQSGIYSDFGFTTSSVKMKSLDIVAAFGAGLTYEKNKHQISLDLRYLHGALALAENGMTSRGVSVTVMVLFPL